MKKNSIFIITVLLLTIIFVTTFLKDSVVASVFRPIDSGSNVVVYFTPHADDEVLTFSVPILNDIRAGKKVYLILMSAGEASKVIHTLNGNNGIVCPWHKVVHNPLTEEYLDGVFDATKLGQARIQEFYRSAAMLGIPKERVQINLVKDGLFTEESVNPILKMYTRLFPNAEFKSMSHVDAHPDHALVGRLIDEMYQYKVISKKQTNFVSIYTARHNELEPTATPIPIVPGYNLRLKDSISDLPKLQAALDVYKEWDPRSGRYGIGYHSVPTQFQTMKQDPYTRVSSY